MAFFTEDFENGTDGVALTTSNTAFDIIVGSPVFTTTSFTGSLAMEIPDVSGRNAVQTPDATGSPTSLYVRFALQLVALPSGKAYLGEIRNPGAHFANWRINPDGVIDVRDENIAKWSSSIALTAGVWYQIQHGVNSSTSTQSLQIYNASGTLLDDSGDISYSSGSPTYSFIGTNTSGTIHALIDDISMNDTPPGPIIATPTSNVSIWDGTSEVPATVTIWDGSTEAPADATVYGGGAPIAHQYAILGDSLTTGEMNEGLSSSLDIALGSGTWIEDDVVGRAIMGGYATPTTQTSIDAWHTAGESPTIWWIQLGGNNSNASDGTWTTLINGVLDLIDDGSIVLWPTMTFRPDIRAQDNRADRFWTVLNQVANSRSDVTTIPCNWDGYVHNGRNESNLWKSDDPSGRHMASAGYALRVQYCVDCLVARDDVYGGGSPKA